MAYAAGKYAKAMCDICGFEVKYTDLQPQWDGFRACPECWTPRHPQDFPKIVITDAEALRHPRPDNDQEAGCGLDVVAYRRARLSPPWKWTESRPHLRSTGDGFQRRYRHPQRLRRFREAHRPQSR